MSRCPPALAASAFLAALAPLAAAAAPPVDLLSHRAAYALSLEQAKNGSQVESARGALVLEWKADCSGWLSQQRLRFVAETSEGKPITYDVRFSSWEAPDNSKLRFQVRSFDADDNGETVSGSATLPPGGGDGSADYTAPDANRVDLPAGTLFPTQHVRHLIEAARAGETIVNSYVFDGSGPDALNKVTAVIGQPKAAPAADAGAAPPVAGAAARRWPVSLAYFGVGKADETPQFQIGFDLGENGVLENIVLDYGDFALKGSLEKLEPLGETSCE